MKWCHMLTEEQELLKTSSLCEFSQVHCRMKQSSSVIEPPDWYYRYSRLQLKMWRIILTSSEMSFPFNLVKWIYYIDIHTHYKPLKLVLSVLKQILKKYALLLFWQRYGLSSGCAAQQDIFSKSFSSQCFSFPDVNVYLQQKTSTHRQRAPLPRAIYFYDALGAFDDERKSAAQPHTYVAGKVKNI